MRSIKFVLYLNPQQQQNMSLKLSQTIHVYTKSSPACFKVIVHIANCNHNLAKLRRFHHWLRLSVQKQEFHQFYDWSQWDICIKKFTI